jgi:hypothetical protein
MLLHTYEYSPIEAVVSCMPVHVQLNADMMLMAPVYAGACNQQTGSDTE